MRNSLLISCFLFYGLSYSQIGVGSSTTNYQEKIRIGGGVAMNFGDHGAFALNISPFIGYEVIKSLEAGISTGYQ